MQVAFTQRADAISAVASANASIVEVIGTSDSYLSTAVYLSTIIETISGNIILTANVNGIGNGFGSIIDPTATVLEVTRQANVVTFTLSATVLAATKSAGLLNSEMTAEVSTGEKTATILE